MEEDLNQQEVDNRIVALVKKGALKIATPADSGQFLFSKSYYLNLPSEGDFILFERSPDGLKLSWQKDILDIPIGELFNIVSIDNNGGPYGQRFDDSEFSMDALERVIPVPKDTFPYDSGNHEYEKSFVIVGSATINVEYVQLRESDQDRAGKFFVTWPGGSRTSGLPKDIKALRVTVGNNPSFDVPVTRDTSVVNAFALVSGKLTADPAGLSGTGSVDMSVNIVFDDDTLAYGDTGEVFLPVATDVDLKFSLDKYSGPSSSNVMLDSSSVKYHHDFETNSGFDIELNNFNFMKSLLGDVPVIANLNRNMRHTTYKLKFDLKRHDKNEWNPGKYRLKVHRQGGAIRPYLHDFQFKHGLTE